MVMTRGVAERCRLRTDKPIDIDLFRRSFGVICLHGGTGTCTFAYFILEILHLLLGQDKLLNLHFNFFHKLVADALVIDSLLILGSSRLATDFTALVWCR